MEHSSLMCSFSSYEENEWHVVNVAPGLATAEFTGRPLALLNFSLIVGEQNQLGCRQVFQPSLTFASYYRNNPSGAPYISQSWL